MTSTLPNDNIKKTFGEQISNKLISEIIRDRIKSVSYRFRNKFITNLLTKSLLNIFVR